MGPRPQLCLADSNILVYAINSASPKHEKAQAFLQTNAKRLVLAHQNLLESLRVLTHKQFPNPMTPVNASVALSSIADSCRLIGPDQTTYYLTLELIKKYELPGDKIFDAYLIATAISNGIELIATDNTKDFSYIEEIKTTNPFK